MFFVSFLSFPVNWPNTILVYCTNMDGDIMDDGDQKYEYKMDEVQNWCDNQLKMPQYYPLFINAGINNLYLISNTFVDYFYFYNLQIYQIYFVPFLLPNYYIVYFL